MARIILIATLAHIPHLGSPGPHPRVTQTIMFGHQLDNPLPILTALPHIPTLPSPNIFFRGLQELLLNNKTRPNSLLYTVRLLMYLIYFTLHIFL